MMFDDFREFWTGTRSGLLTTYLRFDFFSDDNDVNPVFFKAIKHRK